MKKERLHAYQMLHRVAQVREVRASQTLAEATAEELVHLEKCQIVEAARDAVTAASRSQVADATRLDMARYEMLTGLDASLATQQYHAAQHLDAAKKITKERAGHSVLAKRYREQIEEYVEELHKAMDQASNAATQEESIELWLGSKDK